MDARGTRVVRHDSEQGAWELVRAQPDPRLRGIMHEYEGYDETRSPKPVLRQEVPSTRVPLIVNFGSRWRLSASADGSGGHELRDSFVAGLAEWSTYVVPAGAAKCIQVNFTPIGAHLFLGLPMHELTNLVVDVDDVLARADRDLVARLEAAPSWESRFALVDTVIASRVASARRPAPEILWAWRALEHTNGSVRVGALAQRVGRSRRHLAVAFREHVGLTPKRFARVVRFSRAVGLIQRGRGGSFAELAYECGYFDQAHLIRDFREFAGTTPVEFARRVIPDGGISGA
jgi:AraC-like DNA-binding protein